MNSDPLVKKNLKGWGIAKEGALNKAFEEGRKGYEKENEDRETGKH
jgi:hypothetical protein